MIEAKNLKKVYKTKGGVVVNALDGVSVKLPDTGMVFILGKSGSGKSTLLNVLGGLDSFDSGEIIIKGTSAKDFKQRHYDSYRNTYIGFIFQEYNILEELTVGANVALAIELQDRRATDEEINSILKEVDLEGYGQRKPNELSGGQKQRVAIARALVKKPEIIMADEPTGALDSATGKQVFDTLKKLSRDKLVLIVSHDREFSEQYADRIIELKDGKIISDVEKEISAAEITDGLLETDDSIIYGDGEINIKSGYTLTEEDRLAINEYLKAYSEGTVIKVGNRLKKKFSAKDFKPTDESKIKSNKLGDFKLIKSKLSIKNAFKLGSGALNHKKIRLVFTIILSLVSFTLFGLADTIAAYNNIETATSSIFDTGVDYASYVKAVKNKFDSYEYWTTHGSYLTKEDIESIKSETGYDVVGVYKRDNELSFSSNIGNNTVDGMTPSVLYSSTLSGLAPITEELVSTHGFTFIGEYPKPDTNEIVLTKYIYDYFEKCGHVELKSDGEVKTDITKEVDLIGKNITLDLDYNGSTTFKIVGIVDTKFDYSRYEKIAKDDAEFTVSTLERMTLSAELSAAQDYSFANVGFVNSKLISDLISKREGMPESPSESQYGHITFYTLKNDDIDDKYGVYGEDGENVISNRYVYYINSLDKVRDNVVWAGNSGTALNDNQVIVNLRALVEIMFADLRYPEAYHDPSKLTGFEKTMYEKCESGEWQINYPYLSSILDDPKYYAAVSYAYHNIEAARAAIKEQYSYTDETLSMLSDDEIITAFTRETTWGTLDDIITDSVVADYVNSILTKYGMTSHKIPDAMKAELIASYTHNGVVYKSYDQNSLIVKAKLSSYYEEILAAKYAAENFEDAFRFYELISHSNDGLVGVPGEAIIAAYSDYVRGAYKNDKIEFTPQSSIGFEEYVIKSLLKIYSQNKPEGKTVLKLDYWLLGGEDRIKNVEIVGAFIPSGATYNGDTFILSENLINKLYGSNRGGIYSYAVGVMPDAKSEIREIVRFSKTHTNTTGDARYDLMNNVTSQLNMVDEILDVLGQVFLYVGIGFAVFASLMLTNFISTSIAYKKQDIGILRAIGSRSADVFRIFFAESFIIAMINYVLALAGTLSVTLVINNLLRNDVGLLITFLNFGIRQIGILFAVSIAVAFIATVLPVYKIASMKPIDAIKNRK